MAVTREELAENLQHIRQRIELACERSGRLPTSVQLMAVSKFQPPATVTMAAALGLTLFGENRVQEAKLKIPQCPDGLTWHLIGHLQSNKARDAVGLFSMVQGVDSLSLAQELARHAEKQGRHIGVLLEINVAGEEAKFGWDATRLMDDLVGLKGLSGLAIQGLMTVAPYTVDPELVRPVFRRLRHLRDEASGILEAPLPILSMGMSGDLEVAIEEGASLVRVGTALFGVRPGFAP